MIILGIDYGRRRVGLAVGNTEISVATPLATLHCKHARATIPDLKTIVAERSIDEVVVGLPLDQHGEIGPMASEVQRWSETLQKAVRIPVHLIDERLTSSWAYQVDQLTDHAVATDEVAAQAILQTYLDRLRSATR